MFRNSGYFYCFHYRLGFFISYEFQATPSSMYCSVIFSPIFSTIPFDDERLPELLFRYRARNFAHTLNEQERERWRVFCQQRLTDPQMGAPLTLAAFQHSVAELSRSATSAQLTLLNEWRRYAEGLSRRVFVEGEPGREE